MLLVALMPEHDLRQVRSPMATETSWEPVMVACSQDVDVSVSWFWEEDGGSDKQVS